MNRLIILLPILFLLSGIGFSQEIIPLYEGKAPGSEDWYYKEIEFTHPRELKLQNGWLRIIQSLDLSWIFC